MGILVIKDLPESVDLDKEAMAAITGGARIVSHEALLAPRSFIGLHVGVVGVPTPRGLAPVTAVPPRPTLLR